MANFSRNTCFFCAEAVRESLVTGLIKLMVNQASAVNIKAQEKNDFAQPENSCNNGEIILINLIVHHLNNFKNNLVGVF